MMEIVHGDFTGNMATSSENRSKSVISMSDFLIMILIKSSTDPISCPLVRIPENNKRGISMKLSTLI